MSNILANAVSNLIQTPKHKIGVYYYPGYKIKAGYPANIDYPWIQIKKDHPERLPEKGEYKDGSQTVVNQQLLEMALMGAAFVSVCWYWESDASSTKNSRRLGPRLNHWIKAYKKSPYKQHVPFYILACNNSAFTWPDTLDNWRNAVRYWVKELFSEPSYMKINGLPVVSIESPDSLQKQAAICNTTVDALLEEARQIAKAEGFGGIWFIGLSDNITYWIGDKTQNILGKLARTGYNMISAYNYHFLWLPPFDGTRRTKAHGGYIKPIDAEHPSLQQVYIAQWKHAVERSPLPVMINMSAGWNSSAWVPSEDSAHDKSQPANEEEFKLHLIAGRDIINTYPEETGGGYGVLTSWNEFGEGAYVEPSKQYGYSLCKTFRNVFW